MIVLEGPDGAGKSTLGQMLLKDGVINMLLPSPRLSIGHGHNLWDRTLRYLKEYDKNDKVAVDRLFFSELVYGKVLRNNVIFSPSEKALASKYLLNGSVLVFCLPSTRDLKFKPDENQATINKILQIWEQYLNIYQVLSMIYNKVYRYEWPQQESYSRLVTKIKENKW